MSCLDFGQLHIEHAVSPVPEKDQDRLLITADFIGVADGATPLSPTWPRNVGAFAGAALGELAAASRLKEIRVTEVWRTAIMASAREFSVTEPTMSCAVAFARVLAGTESIEVSSIGDCCIIIGYRDGSVRRLTDPRLPQLDRVAMASGGREVRRLQLENRARMNTDDGYWIFAADPRAADHVMSAHLDVAELDALAICTDGFYRALDTYHLVADDGDLLAMIRSRGPQGAVAEVRRFEATHGAEFAGSRPDDATVVLASRPR